MELELEVVHLYLYFRVQMNQIFKISMCLWWHGRAWGSATGKLGGTGVPTGTGIPCHFVARPVSEASTRTGPRPVRSGLSPVRSGPGPVSDRSGPRSPSPLLFGPRSRPVRFGPVRSGPRPISPLATAFHVATWDYLPSRQPLPQLFAWLLEDLCTKHKDEAVLSFSSSILFSYLIFFPAPAYWTLLYFLYFLCF